MNKEKELLRKQIALLAEQSRKGTTFELPGFTSEMCHVYKTLEAGRTILNSVLLFVVGINLGASILILGPKLFGRKA